MQKLHAFYGRVPGSSGLERRHLIQVMVVEHAQIPGGKKEGDALDRDDENPQMPVEGPWGRYNWVELKAIRPGYVLVQWPGASPCQSHLANRYALQAE
jgi:hypothetical protein